MTRRNALVAALLLLCVIDLAWVAVTFNGIAAPLSTGSVTLSNPSDVAVDPAGNIFIADTSNNQIVEVSPGGTSSRVCLCWDCCLPLPRWRAATRDICRRVLTTSL
jgi:NHL repeat